MRKSPSSLLRRAQRVAVSAAAVLSVTALGVIPAVAPAVTADEQALPPADSQPPEEARPSAGAPVAEDPQPSVNSPVSEQTSPSAGAQPLADASTSQAPQSPAGAPAAQPADAVPAPAEAEEQNLPLQMPEDLDRSAEVVSNGSFPFRSVDGLTGSRAADGFQFGEPDLRNCEEPKYYLWVGTGGGETNSDESVLGKGWIAKVEMDPSFGKGKIIQKIKTTYTYKFKNRPKTKDLTFGDIAVVHDYSKVYGITLFSKKALENDKINNRTKIYQYDEETGNVIWAKHLALKDTAGNDVSFAFNSLSVGPSNELLFSSYATGEIYFVNPEDPNSLDDQGRLVVTKLGKFPKTGGKEDEQIISAGDFIVMPDKSLLGFGTYKNKTYVVKWENLSADTPRVAPKYSSADDGGKIIGTMDTGVWGVARVGSHILAVPSVDGKGNHLDVLDINIEDGKEVSVEEGEKPKYPNISYSKIAVDGFAEAAYGASSSGDTGPLSCEARIRTKVNFNDAEKILPNGRAVPGTDDQAQVWTSDSYGSTLAPRGVSIGEDPGVQKAKQEEVVVPGSTVKIHQRFLRNGKPQAIGGFYNTTVSCVDGHGAELLEAAVKNIEYTGDEVTAEVTIPAIENPQQDPTTRDLEDDTTTCTFVNTAVERPFSLPMTGARADFWQLFAGVVVLVGFAAFPLWRRRRVA